MNVWAVAVCAALLTGSAAHAQQVQLGTDTEYMGALLSGASPIRLSPNGRVQNGTLKTDYTRGPYVFAAGTGITFDESGRVAIGTLKQDATDGTVSYAAGLITFHPNGAVASAQVKPGFAESDLVIPVAGRVTINGGRIAGFSPASPSPYRLLGRTLQRDVRLGVDPNTQAYYVQNGTVGQPTLIARVVKRWNSEGTPAESVPIIAPVGSSFNVHYTPGLPSDFSAQWFINGFTLNGIGFGPTPSVWIRDMRVRMVQVSTTITIGGHTYMGGDRVVFDDQGSVVPPS